MKAKSIWIFKVNGGGCGACDLEFLALKAPPYDIERLGIRLVATPRQADCILITGPITRQLLPRISQAILAAPAPVTIIAFGSCAISGGPQGKTYATLSGIEGVMKYMEETYGKTSTDNIKKIIYIPGCPPKPGPAIKALISKL
jgi:Ni,Fe-hydrogenase III small subunit